MVEQTQERTREKRLMAVMLFWSWGPFSLSELRTIIAEGDPDEETEWITTLLNELQQKGFIEPVDGELAGDRSQSTFFRVTLDTHKRNTFYQEVIPEQDPSELVGDGFNEALRLLEEAKTGLACVEGCDNRDSSIQQLSKKLTLAFDYLEVAFYEQSPAAQEGSVGDRIREKRNEVIELQEQIGKLSS